jgi:8-oxo-dGTP diphosphatase
MTGFVIPEDELRKQAAADGATHLVTGAAIIKDGKVLGLRREPNDYPGGVFELPGGGVDEGETLAAAVARKVMEEAGLTVENIVGMFPGFDYSTPKKPKARQFNFLVVTTDGEVRLSPEHDAWEWIDETNIDTLPITDAMRQCFRDALAVAEDLQDMFIKEQV